MTKRLLVPVLLLVALLGGCAHQTPAPTGARSAAPSARSGAGDFTPDRMLVGRANLELEVGDVNRGVAQAVGIVEKEGGYLEWRSEDAQLSAQARFRIPVKGFKGALGSLEALGAVVSRSVNGTDVTEQYVDVAARLKNKYVLRDRFKQLLEKAVSVNDMLSIETELNRVQSDIDSMEATIKSLKGQVDFATVDLKLKRDQVLGPLGYACKGIWWGVKKLFVLRD